MKRFDLDMDGSMDEFEGGRWIRYADHCEAMKRIAGAPIVMEQSKERDAAFEEWIYSQRADVDPYEVWHAACEWQSKMRAALSAGEAQQGLTDEGAMRISLRIMAGLDDRSGVLDGIDDDIKAEIADEIAVTIRAALTPPRQMVADNAAGAASASPTALTEAIAHAKDMVRGHYPNHREYIVAAALLAASPADQVEEARDAARYRKMRDWFMREGLRAEIAPNGHIQIVTAEIVDGGVDAMSASKEGV